MIHCTICKSWTHSSLDCPSAFHNRPAPGDSMSAQILIGHAIIAEAAAADLRNAGLDTANLDAIAKHYREFAAQIDPSTASVLRAVR